MTKKILITEKVADECLGILRRHGYEVDVCLGLSHDELVERIAPYDALIVRSATKVDKAVINAASQLKIIGRAGRHDRQHRRRRRVRGGRHRLQRPTSNIVSAAEHTMGASSFPPPAASPRRTPRCMRGVGARRLHGHRAVRQDACHLRARAHRRLGSPNARGAFGMRLIGCDPYCSPDRADQLGVKLYETTEETISPRPIYHGSPA